mmetsp:Transcript_26510/g.62258  ORF Transcript_26510/g.62258 Transcript_26510/m.62258 type:complete len:260 (+) Transcript_26510:151-930(+)
MIARFVHVQIRKRSLGFVARGNGQDALDLPLRRHKNVIQRFDKGRFFEIVARLGVIGKVRFGIERGVGTGQGPLQGGTPFHPGFLAFRVRGDGGRGIKGPVPIQVARREQIVHGFKGFQVEIARQDEWNAFDRRRIAGRRFLPVVIIIRGVVVSLLRLGCSYYRSFGHLFHKPCGHIRMNRHGHGTIIRAGHVVGSHHKFLAGPGISEPCGNQLIVTMLGQVPMIRRSLFLVVVVAAGNDGLDPAPQSSSPLLEPNVRR